MRAVILTVLRNLPGSCDYGLHCWSSTPLTRPWSLLPSPTTSCSPSFLPASPQTAVCACWLQSACVSAKALRCNSKLGLVEVVQQFQLLLAMLVCSALPLPFSVADMGELLQCALGHLCSRCLHCQQAHGVGPHHYRRCRPDMQRSCYVLPFL